MSMTHILYLICICMWMAYTTQAFEALPRNPLEGSPERFPGAYKFGDSWEGKEYVYYDNKNLTKLLDVGACSLSGDPNISYVPPLDGTSPTDTVCQDRYAMKFVLFDLQLIELKSVDPIGGSFRAEFQMILHWVDSVFSGPRDTPFNESCSFPCDNTSPRPLCCDNVWVPPVHLPTCDINKIQSSTPRPYIVTIFGKNLSYNDCFNETNKGRCIWRRLWYLNIDATCASQMDFHNFPFDMQTLTIDILNPYASRTWFQLTKGFLQDNIGEDINNLNLSPDKNIPGWYVEELRVSGTCGTSQNWKQTFLTQDILLRQLNNSYKTQEDDISNALSLETLICSKMEDFNDSAYVNKDFTSPTNHNLYKNVTSHYEETIVKPTLEKYTQCTKEIESFYWNMSAYDDKQIFSIQNFEDFSTSRANIDRSFSILDLTKGNNLAKVSFSCAIRAIASLTTPGVRVTILVQRYRIFYVVKIVLPTIACVAFSFATFGINPKDLVGRLTVVVPSAIALTALQGLVVSTDIPPVAYIAPSTYIFLYSYLVQILIAFESIFVNWLYSRNRQSKTRVLNAPIMNARKQSFHRVTEGGNTMSSEIFPTISITEKGSIEMCSTSNERGSTIDTEGAPNEVINDPNSRNEDPNGQRCVSRKIDLIAMGILGMLYILAILLCTIHPWHRSQMLKKVDSSGNFLTLWTPSSN